MQTLPTVYPCKTKEELQKQVLDVHQSIADFYRSLPDDIFGCRAIPDGWSVKRNMKHVISTNFIFGVWIGLPTSILKIFGKPKAKQPTIDEIVATNRLGITNYGRYENSKSANPEKKSLLLNKIMASAEKLNKQISKHTDEELDNLPGLFGVGGTSLRTLILFLIKHNIHHTNIVKIRMEESI